MNVPSCTCNCGVSRVKGHETGPSRNHANNLAANMRSMRSRQFFCVTCGGVFNVVLEHGADAFAEPPAVLAAATRSRQVVRVLVIPVGSETDAEGRAAGDDWLLASLGYTDDEPYSGGAHVYLTTDRLHGSDVPAALNSALETARVIALLLNDLYGGKRLLILNDLDESS